MPLAPDLLAILERFRPAAHGPAAGIRTWHILTRSADSVRAAELVRLGLLEHRRQARKGFPRLHRITDAGIAELPDEAAGNAPGIEQLLGHYSPPRGR